ncbi:hypothetical protein AB0M92_10680 [Streptomyces sp. NPDC051582]|uniref:hypothetical protein n=1 Tax=Streptomyces sp. NPDC051582 TaxID=3155167 RepID=UPI0034312D11
MKRRTRPLVLDPLAAASLVAAPAALAAVPQSPPARYSVRQGGEWTRCSGFNG